MEKLLTIEEVASWLRLSKDSVYRLTQEAKIPAFKVGNQWRFRKSEIEAWLDKNKNSVSRKSSHVAKKSRRAVATQQ